MVQPVPDQLIRLGLDWIGTNLLFQGSTTPGCQDRVGAEPKSVDSMKTRELHHVTFPMKKEPSSVPKRLMPENQLILSKIVDFLL